MTTETQILAAFWHKGRKCAVPLIRAEIESKTGIPDEELQALLYRLARNGLVASSAKGKHANIYEITPAGLAEIEVK
jgi:predicted transcriptional regulator